MQTQLGRQILYRHTLSTRQAAVAELLPGVDEQGMNKDTFLQRKASACLPFFPSCSRGAGGDRDYRQSP